MIIDISDDMLAARCKASCDTWPKVPDGCAALCMGRLGGIPREGCAYRVAVHGKRVRAILEAALRVVFS